MRGAVFRGNRKIDLRNFLDPTPCSGEVLNISKPRHQARVIDARRATK
jgi:hypothetical protein